jgi:hypothetical protein
VTVGSIAAARRGRLVSEAVAIKHPQTLATDLDLGFTAFADGSDELHQAGDWKCA